MRSVCPAHVFRRSFVVMLAGLGLASSGGCKADPKPRATEPAASSAPAVASSVPANVAPPHAEPETPPVDLTTVKCPADMVPIWKNGGCIDKWEASAGTGALGAPDGTGTTVVARSAAKQVPLTGVTRKQAFAACTNAGKRLCRDEEWKNACRGKPRVEHRDDYTYGSEYEKQRCHDWDASDGAKKGATRTGEHPRCVSSQGAFDLTGNVGEMTDGPGKNDRMVVRGGTYVTTVHDSACDSSGYRVGWEETGPAIGFRCCADAK